MPQGSLVYFLKIQTARSAIRHAGARCPMHQRSPLRGQIMGIHAKPQRTRHREYGAAHTQKAQEQAPRQPRVISMQLDRDRNLLWRSSVRMCTKRLAQDTTTCRPGLITPCLHSHRSNLPGCRQIHCPPVMVSTTAGHCHQIRPIQTARTEKFKQRRTHILR